MLHTEDLCGGMWVEQDGQVNPVDLCMAYAKGAKAKGVIIRENASVIGVESDDGAVSAVTLADGRRIECEKVVNCAGAWARQLGELSGVKIPLIACEHIYVVTEPIAQLPQPVPIVRDLENAYLYQGRQWQAGAWYFRRQPESIGNRVLRWCLSHVRRRLGSRPADA